MTPNPLTPCLTLLVALALLGSGCGDDPRKNTMPPGLELVVNEQGQYRARYTGRDWVLSRYPLEFFDTKGAAMRRAWGQYDFENPVRETENWEVVKP